MKGTYKASLPLLCGLLMLLTGCSIGGCGNDSARSVEPRYGIVRMEEVVKLNPEYAKYKELEKEYDNLQSQYQAEQQELSRRAAEQAETLKQVGSDSSILGALENEYKSRISIKEKEINARLNEAFSSYVQEYKDTVKEAPGETELKIVNLQLELRSLMMSPESRAAKEKELQSLLANRAPSIVGNNKAIIDKVSEKMAPLKSEAEKEMAAYADEVMKELVKKRDEQMKAKSDALQGGLPNPIEWNEAWKKKLEAKQAEVKAVHDSILADIRARVASIAKEKGVDLVVSEYRQNRTAIDITDAIIASYGK